MEPDGDVHRRAHRLNPHPDLLRQECARGIGKVDIVRAVGFHLFRLLCQPFRVEHVRHHQESDRHHAHLFGSANVLGADVRLGCVGRDADDGSAAILRPLQIGNRADARQQQNSDFRAGDALCRGFDQRKRIVFREAVGVAGAAKPVAMRNLDDGQSAAIEP